MRHLVIPDTQCKPGYATEHLEWVGKYAAEKKPEVIVHLGDHWDMPSLSVYDVGKKAFEGRTYQSDITAGNLAMNRLMKPIVNEINRLKRNRKKTWNPKLVFLIGNHEQRIERAIESDRKLEGLVGYNDFNLKQYGWEVQDFLDVKIINIDVVLWDTFKTELYHLVNGQTVLVLQESLLVSVTNMTKTT